MTIIRQSFKETLQQYGGSVAGMCAVMREVHKELVQDNKPELSLKGIQDINLADAFETLVGISPYRLRDVQSHGQLVQALHESSVGMITPGALANFYDLGTMMATEAFRASMAQVSVEQDIYNLPTVETVPVWTQEQWVANLAIPGSTATDDSRVRPGEPGKRRDMKTYQILRPELLPRHRIVSLSMEALVNDPTGNLLRDAQTTAADMLNEAYIDLLNCLVGAARPYGVGAAYELRERINGTPLDRETYYATGDSGPWVNKLASNVIASYADLQVIKDLMQNMKHPVNTTRKLSIPFRHLIACSAKEPAIQNVLRSIETRTTDGSIVTLSTQNQFADVKGLYSQLLIDVIRNKIAAANTDAKANEYVFCGDVTRAITRYQGQDLTVETREGNMEYRTLLDVHILLTLSHVCTSPRHIFLSYND